MGLFKKQQRIRQQHRKPIGGLIQCTDCGALGHIAWYGLSDYVISTGWVLTWCGLKPLYICPRCQANRIKRYKELLKE